MYKNNVLKSKFIVLFLGFVFLFSSIFFLVPKKVSAEENIDVLLYPNQLSRANFINSDIGEHWSLGGEFFRDVLPNNVIHFHGHLSSQSYIWLFSYYFNIADYSIYIYFNTPQYFQLYDSLHYTFWVDYHPNTFFNFSEFATYDQKTIKIIVPAGDYDFYVAPYVFLGDWTNDDDIYNSLYYQLGNTKGYINGVDFGYDAGLIDGYDLGYQSAFNESGELNTPFDIIANGVDRFLDIQIFNGVKISLILQVGFGAILLGFALKVFLGG